MPRKGLLYFVMIDFFRKVCYNLSREYFLKNRKGGEFMVISTMNKREITEVENWIRENNEKNSLVKFFPEIRDGVLVLINTRLISRNGVDQDTLNSVYDEIETRSARRVFPSRDGMLPSGVLTLHVSYVHRVCGAKNIIAALEYISGEMLESL